MIDVGIGLPSMFPGVGGPLLLEWARRADRAGFASVSTGERIAFECHDLLVTMAMVGAVTERVRIMPTVLATPLHRTTLLAKQAASLDVLTGGRLVLGLGISERPDDFGAVGVPYAGRGERFERQLESLRRVWAGDALADGLPRVGPTPRTPGGPPVLIGAFTEPALRRAGRLADGLVSFDFVADPARQRAAYDVVAEEWGRVGRAGRPRFVAGTYFALGPDARARAEAWIRDYYGYLPRATQDWFVEAVTTTSDHAVADTIERSAAAGADEVYFSPMIPELDQVDRLAGVVRAIHR